MPHLREIPKPRCRCGKPATVELFNDRNAPMGSYCKSCGNAALKRAQGDARVDHAMRAHLQRMYSGQV